MQDQKTPVLLVIFNRPQKVQALIDALAAVAPRQVYIIADGPRTHVVSDKAKCEEARRIATNIPWECEVHTKFLEENIGCDSAVPLGIDWFFENVTEGIILEDDCIPGPSFFSFCTELLEKYRDDEKIMHISGNNFQNGIKRGDASYYFSLYTHSWGWATWKRAWQNFHPAIADMDNFIEQGGFEKLSLSKESKSFWKKNMSLKKYWDGLWQYTVWHEGGLSLVPNQNLVSNIGFGSDATHTIVDVPLLSNIKSQSVSDLTHSTEFTPNREADEYVFRHIFHMNMIKKVYFKVMSFIKIKK